MHDDRQALRMAAHRGDGQAIVDAVTGADLGLIPLQETGTALLVALGLSAPQARELAVATRDQLVTRDWPGDAELGELLHAAVTGVSPLRRTVPVDLEELAMALEGDPAIHAGAFLDLRTGEIWPEAVLEDWGGDDDPPDIDAEPDRWLHIWPTGSRDGWQDMADFIDEVHDDRLAQRLDDAVHGRGAFSRFRRVLDGEPQVRAQWYVFSDDRRLGRARAWLRDAGFDPTPPPTPQDSAPGR